MFKHEFIFSKGIWIGEGKITFSGTPEHVRFFTKWDISEEEKGAIACQQTVEMEGNDEKVSNAFTFSDVNPDSFSLQLSNNLIGVIKGKGILDAKTVAWEFRGYPHFEGFEVYELQDNGDYMLHAEYTSPDHFRTIIDGRIWPKSL